MNKKSAKVLAWILLLGAFATLANGCYWWWGPRRHWHPGWRDDGGWHEGYYGR